jgi:hypothetical protein
MKYNKNKLAMIILIGVIIISACTQSYSQAPAATATLIPPNLFVSPFPSVENPMALIEDFAKGTATAAVLTAAAGGVTPVTPETVTPVTFTVTPITFTPTLTPVVAPVCTAPACSGVGYKLTCPSGNCVGGCGYVCTFGQTPAPPSVSGNIYYLKQDEFPFCIARRFAVDPDDMVYNKSSIYYEGFPINMPQNSSWPASAGPIDLRAHPDTYIVTGNADTTVYGVACKYGHVDPKAIAQLNGISDSAALSIGQQIKIP